MNLSALNLLNTDFNRITTNALNIQLNSSGGLAAFNENENVEDPTITSF